MVKKKTFGKECDDNWTLDLALTTSLHINAGIDSFLLILNSLEAKC